MKTLSEEVLNICENKEVFKGKDLHVDSDGAVFMKKEMDEPIFGLEGSGSDMNYMSKELLKANKVEFDYMKGTLRVDGKDWSDRMGWY